MKRTGVNVLVVVLVLAGFLAVAAVAVSRPASSPLASDGPAVALLVPVVESKRQERFVVGLTVRREDGFAVRVAAAGTVTSLNVSPGSTVAPGETVATVDDLPLVAMGGPAPLHRDLGPGAAGADVERLQAYLRLTGFYDGEGDAKLGASTAAAVQRWNKANGRSGSTFSVASVLWIGDDPLVADVVQLRVGDTVAAGDTLITGANTILSIAVDEPVGGVGPGPHELRVGPVTVPYDATGAAIITASDAATVAAAMRADEGAGQVVQTTGQTVLTIPATAVVTDLNGTTCVFPDASAPAVVVAPVGSQAGSVMLPAGTALAQVLANPGEIRERLTCSS